MSDGWFKLYRKLSEHPRFTDGSWLKVWIFLLTNATHKERFIIFEGRRVTLLPGQLITSRLSIVNSCKVNRSKVERILKTLENEHQIEQRTCNTCRLISITNWDNYQSIEQPFEQQVSNKRATSEQQVSTHKKDKNDKKIKDMEENPFEIALSASESDSLPVVAARKKDELEFEEFWKAFPKKKSKGAAEVAWKKIKPSAELRQKIMKAIETQKQSKDWQRDGGQFIPYPATWLNGQGWLDECHILNFKKDEITFGVPEPV